MKLIILPSYQSHKTLLITKHTLFYFNTKPQNYIFANYKYTSPFTMTNLYTIDHSRRTVYIRNYDPNKQYFCLLPHNDTSRPLIVPQDYLVHFDDFFVALQHFYSDCKTSRSYKTPYFVSIRWQRHILYYCSFKTIPLF